MLTLKCIKPIIEALSYNVFHSLFANPRLETCLVWIRHQPGQGKQLGHPVLKELKGSLQSRTKWTATFTS